MKLGVSFSAFHIPKYERYLTISRPDKWSSLFWKRALPKQGSVQKKVGSLNYEEQAASSRLRIPFCSSAIAT